MKLKKIKNIKIQVEYENSCQVFGLAVIELDTKEEKEVAIYISGDFWYVDDQREFIDLKSDEIDELNEIFQTIYAPHMLHHVFEDHIILTRPDYINIEYKDWRK